MFSPIRIQKLELANHSLLSVNKKKAKSCRGLPRSMSPYHSNQGRQGEILILFFKVLYRHCTTR